MSWLSFELVGTIVALALIAVGIVAIFFPKALSHGYGVPAEGEPAHGYVRALGARDIGLGVLLAATVATKMVPMIAIFCVVGIAVSLADFVIAYHSGGRRFHFAHGIHASGVVAFVLVLAMALFAIGR